MGGRQVISDDVWSRIRDEFPALKQVNYLDNASNGLVPLRVHKVFDSHFALFGEADSVLYDSPAYTQLTNFQQARNALARLISAHPSEVCLTDSTSHAMQIVSRMIPLGERDNVVISDQEFLGTTLPWIMRAQEHGFTIRRVSAVDGAVEADAILDAVDDSTKVVVVSSVYEVSGYRIGLNKISEALRNRGVCLVVDAIQHIGALPFDVKASPVDFLCCGGHKWLMSPWGTGFLYMNRDWVQRVPTPTRGYFNIVEPEGGWYKYLGDPSRTPFDDWRFIDDASKFETGGTGNSVGFAMLVAVIDWMFDIGLDEIHNKVMANASTLIEFLKRIPSVQVCDYGENNRSAVVSVKTPLSPMGEVMLTDVLRARGVKVAQRHMSGVGGIRVSPHFYNNEEDLESFAEHFETVLAMS